MMNRTKKGIKMGALALAFVLSLSFALPVGVSAMGVGASTTASAVESQTPASETTAVETSETVAPAAASASSSVSANTQAASTAAQPSASSEPAVESTPVSTPASSEAAASESVPAKEPAPTKHLVTFYVGGSIYYQQMVEDGATLAAPQQQPRLAADQSFLGWYEEDAVEAFGFDVAAVTAPLNLYAKTETVEAEQPAAEQPAEQTGESEPQQPAEEQPAVQPASEMVTQADTPQPANSEYTVTFLVGGGAYYTDIVPNETLVTLPADPTSAEGAFVGWYTEDGLPFNTKALITSDLTLNAKFSDEAVVVTYLNTDGLVLEVLEGTIGQPAPAPTKQPTVSNGKELLHWALQGSEDEFAGNLTANTTLVPMLTDVALAVFVTNGSEIDPQTGQDGFSATRPTNPTRTGYNFVGWSADKAGTADDFDFSTPISGTQFIYAVWEAAEANYTLNLWVESANATNTANPLSDRSGYELQYTAVQQGTTGETVELDAAEARTLAGQTTGDVKNLLVYSTFKASESKTISPNGDTVVNVYFTRTEFTIIFDVTGFTGGEIFIGDGVSVGNKYELTIKVEQDVSQVWPTSVSLGTSYFVNWGGYYGNSAQKVSYGYISNGFSNSSHSDTTGKMTGYQNNVTTPVKYSARMVPQVTTNPYTGTRYYYTELSADEKAEYLANGALSTGEDVRSWTASHATYGGLRYYKLAQTAVLEYQSSWNPAGWPGRDIAGYETIGMSSSTATCKTTNFQQVVDNGKNNIGNRNDYSIYYYMPAKTYTLTLVTGQGAAVTDPSSFGLTAGSGVYTASLGYNEAVALPGESDIARSNYKLVGWYLDEHFVQPYTGGNMPSSNLTLYAKYVGTEVTVIYTDGEEIARRTYSRDEVLAAHDLTGTAYEGYTSGDEVPGKGKLTGWYYEVGTTTKATVAFPLGLPLTRDEYVLTAQLDPGDFTVTFEGDEGGSDNLTYDAQKVKAGSLNTLARSGHTALRPSREGYTFGGWTTVEGGTTANFTTATRVTENITVYAIWKIIPVTVTYDANGGALTTADLTQTVDYGQSLAGAGLALPGSSAVAYEGYRFLGWYTAKTNGAAFTADDLLATDITVYARWEKVEQPTGGTSTPEPSSSQQPDPSSSEPVSSEVAGSSEAPASSSSAGSSSAVPTTSQGSSTTSDSDSTAVPVVGAAAAGTTPPAAGDGTGGAAIDTAPSVNAEAAVPAETLEQLNNQTGNLMDDVLSNNIPLFSGDGSVWSLASLFMGLVAFISSVVLGLTMIRRKGEESDQQDDQKDTRRRSRLLKAIAILPGVITGLLFLVLNNMNNPVALFNESTPLIALFFLAHLVLVVVQLVRGKKARANRQDNNQPMLKA